VIGMWYNIFQGFYHHNFDIPVALPGSELGINKSLLDNYHDGNDWKYCRLMTGSRYIFSFLFSPTSVVVTKDWILFCLFNYSNLIYSVEMLVWFGNFPSNKFKRPLSTITGGLIDKVPVILNIGYRKCTCIASH